jgi:hypothetical protein
MPAQSSFGPAGFRSPKIPWPDQPKVTDPAAVRNQERIKKNSKIGQKLSASKREFAATDAVCSGLQRIYP